MEPDKCPECGSTNITAYYDGDNNYDVECDDCDFCDRVDG